MQQKRKIEIRIKWAIINLTRDCNFHNDFTCRRMSTELHCLIRTIDISAPKVNFKYQTYTHIFKLCIMSVFAYIEIELAKIKHTAFLLKIKIKCFLIANSVGLVCTRCTLRCTNCAPHCAQIDIKIYVLI